MRNKRIHPSIVQFFNDLGIKLRFCRTRTPETKGKDETSNKFAKRLKSYDGKIEDKHHLLKIIDKLNIDINRQKNSATNIAPIILFQKEKEHLSPLPNNHILSFYEDEMHSCKVPSTFLINYKGAKYSVPPYLITKTVNYKERNGILYIYYKKELVVEHEIKSKHSINYVKDHYKQGLIGKLKNDNEIEELTTKNLAKFKDFGEK